MPGVYSGDRDSIQKANRLRRQAKRDPNAAGKNFSWAQRVGLEDEPAVKAGCKTNLTAGCKNMKAKSWIKRRYYKEDNVKKCREKLGGDDYYVSCYKKKSGKYKLIRTPRLRLSKNKGANFRRIHALRKAKKKSKKKK